MNACYHHFGLNIDGKLSPYATSYVCVLHAPFGEWLVQFSPLTGGCLSNALYGRGGVLLYSGREIWPQ